MDSTLNMGAMSSIPTGIAHNTSAPAQPHYPPYSSNTWDSVLDTTTNQLSSLNMAGAGSRMHPTGSNMERATTGASSYGMGASSAYAASAAGGPGTSNVHASFGSRSHALEDEDVVLTRLSSDMTDAEFIKACSQPLTLLGKVSGLGQRSEFANKNEYKSDAYGSAARTSVGLGGVGDVEARAAGPKIIKPPAVERQPHEWYGKQHGAGGDLNAQSSGLSRVSCAHLALEHTL